MKIYAQFRLISLAFLAALMFGCAGTASRESTGEYIDDAAITAKVKTVLLADKQVSGLAINVDTIKGTVYLNGAVKSETERERAAQLAKEVKGVKGVKNELRLK